MAVAETPAQVAEILQYVAMKPDGVDAWLETSLRRSADSLMTATPSRTLKGHLTWSLLFAALATIIAGYLLWATTGERGQVLGCGPGSGCDKVLGSRWSLWLGQPVSLLAIGFYAPFLLCLFNLRRSGGDHSGWLPWLVAIASSGGLVMLWFVVLQAAVIESFCAYCLADHALGLLAIACLLLYASRSRVHTGIAQWALSLILAGAFVAVHIVFAPTRIHVVAYGKTIDPKLDAENLDSTDPNSVVDPVPTSPQKRSRMVSLLGGQVKFNIDEIPHLGSPEAEFVIMELLDYTCSHCRALHPHLHHALERYGNQLAIVTLPVPMNSSCNPDINFSRPDHEHACTYAIYSMAVRAFDRERYAQYHNWLMSGEKLPTPEAARARAEMIVGAGNCDSAPTNHLVQGWLKSGRAMYRLANKGAIPKLIVGSKIVNVPYTTSDKLFEFLESGLGIKPVARDE